MAASVPAVKIVFLTLLVILLLGLGGYAVYTALPVSATPTPSAAPATTAVVTAPGPSSATPAATPAPSPGTCNQAACESVIDSYITKGWTYTSSDFSQCAGCPTVRYPQKLIGTTTSSPPKLTGTVLPAPTMATVVITNPAYANVPVAAEPKLQLVAVVPTVSTSPVPIIGSIRKLTAF